MVSKRGALLLGLLLAGCGQGVHDLSVSGDPLLVVHGHVDLSALKRQHPEAPLIGALVWAGIPQVSPLCLKFDDDRIKPACPDPYGYFYGEIEHAAPVDADGNFALPLPHLPKASVSVGDERTRIAYGSLLVAEDRNQDGQLSLISAGSSRRNRDRGDLPALLGDPDTIVGASFYTLRGDQQRLVFREGGFVEASNFYPAPGCAPPPPSFSVMLAPPLVEPPAVPGVCAFYDAARAIEVAPLSASDGLAMMCRPAQRAFFFREPQADEPPSKGATVVCLSHEIFAAVESGPCPRFRAYALKGCQDDPFCDKPDWDVTRSPPTWWPCR